MQSNTPTSTATIRGLNIRADRGTREARPATGQEAAEWSELVGLEVGRQVSIGDGTSLCKLTRSIYVTQLERLNDMLQVETKILDGAELMLEAQLKVRLHHFYQIQ